MPATCRRYRGRRQIRTIASFTANICDAPSMEQAIAGFRPERIMHLAAESHVDRSITGAARFHRDQRRRHVHAARGGARLLVERLDAAARERSASSTSRPTRSTARSATRALFTEDTPYDPNSPYSASKAASDHLVRAWHHTYGLPVVVSNCSNNYGPYQFPEKLIPLTILNALAGEPLPVYGTGENVRDWLYVEDHAAGARSDRRARAGSARPTTSAAATSGATSTWCATICDVLDELAPADRPRERADRVRHRPARATTRAMRSTRPRSRRELGWRARENFDTGIEKTVRWYLDNEWWWRPLRERYNGERLGLLKSAKA